LSVVLLVAASLGMLLGGLLIGRWALGVCVIADSLAVGVFALQWDDGNGAQPQVHAVPTLHQVLDRVGGHAAEYRYQTLSKSTVWSGR
jgi:hypothetical protein